jgi:hypothetical protein
LEVFMMRTNVDKPHRRRSVLRILVVSASAAMLSLGGSNAWAQQSSAPVLDSVHPQIEPWPAPVGTRQPQRKDLPPRVRKDEGAITPGQRDFDASLNICRC